MAQIMIVLVELKFDGIIVLNHAPAVEDGHGPEQAYGFAHRNALKGGCLAVIQGYTGGGF
jgi:hypothetical protein